MNQVMAITGGSRGIGRLTAELAARRGYDLAIGYRQDRDAAEAVVQAAIAQGRQAIAVRADMAKPQEIASMFRTIDEALGPLTHLVNSAGISPMVQVRDVDAEQLLELWTINISGTILCCREAIDRMIPNRFGSIVNVSSMAATGGGRDGFIPYAASKGAVDSFTIGLGKELAASGIRVNGVRPGMTVTDMTAQIHKNAAVRERVEATIPMRRLGEAGEVAEAILWLLSDAASFVTASFIDVGGGGFAVASHQCDER